MTYRSTLTLTSATAPGTQIDFETSAEPDDTELCVTIAPEHSYGYGPCASIALDRAQVTTLRDWLTAVARGCHWPLDHEVELYP